MRAPFAVILFVMLHLSGEVFAVPLKGAPRFANSDLGLTNAQRDKLIAEANAGNNTAAARLGMYYDFTTSDRESAYYWFRKAALNGHLQSQYNLGVRSLGKRSLENCIEAKYWFEMASKNGMEKAQQALERLDDCTRWRRENPDS